MLNPRHALIVRVFGALVLAASVFVPAVPADSPASADTASADTASADTTDDTAESANSTGSSASSDVQQVSSGVTTPGGMLSKLEVHGFLTQAYATAKFSEGGFSSPTTQENTLGIPEDGTTNYRKLALQFRYEISPRDIMILQFSSRALGDSPVEEGVEPEIKVDWAFYERKIGDNTSVKVGRVQLPIGIYNEVRDVGTILPFYRPSVSIYGAGLFTSETIDGVVLSHTFAPQSDWSLEADVYFGEWDIVEINPFGTGGAVVARAENALGGQVWLNTPVLGLRFGLGYSRSELTGGLEGIVRGAGEKVRRDFTVFSIEYASEKFAFRAEGDILTDQESEVFFEADFISRYAQVSYNPSEKFQINLQAEVGTSKADKEASIGVVGLPLERDLNSDFASEYAVGLNYLFSPNLVLKLEHHFEVESVQFMFDGTVDTPNGPALKAVTATSSGGEYTILSLSASF